MKVVAPGFLMFVCALVLTDGAPMQTEPSAVQRLAGAITELKAVVKEDPRNADTHNLLAYSFREQAKPDLPMAFEHYRTALKLNPDHNGAHEYIGEA
jgi:tetratricopeptide (TPR) repeat protein